MVTSWPCSYFVGSSANSRLKEGMLLPAGSFPCLEDSTFINCYLLGASSTVVVATFAAVDLEMTLVCSAYEADSGS